uniref:Secreted protein n=1 Tax=Strongyloides venezuelensis TaxID=75913 RepID=A0A0K0G5V3_STRVS
MAVKFGIRSFARIIYFLQVVAFDLTSVGDFYFLIYSCGELRRVLKKFLGCSKKFNNIINIKISYQKPEMIFTLFFEFHPYNVKKLVSSTAFNYSHVL